eukprot:scaffold330238_cov59-Tisochrysis_lutea.AAC.8
MHNCRSHLGASGTSACMRSALPHAQGQGTYVETPRDCISPAPTRARMASTGDKIARSQGTKQPTWTSKMSGCILGTPSTLRAFEQPE